MDDSGRAPGFTKLLFMGKYPNAFDWPGMEKSFISLFMMTPVSGIIKCEPNRRLIVVVKDIASPELSAALICDVPGVSIDSSPSGS